MVSTKKPPYLLDKFNYSASKKIMKLIQKNCLFNNQGLAILIKYF